MLAIAAAAFGGGGLISLSGNPNNRSNFVTAFAFASAMQLISLPMIARLDFSDLQVRAPHMTTPANPTAHAPRPNVHVAWAKETICAWFCRNRNRLHLPPIAPRPPPQAASALWSRSRPQQRCSSSL